VDKVNEHKRDKALDKLLGSLPDPVMPPGLHARVMNTRPRRVMQVKSRPILSGLFDLFGPRRAVLAAGLGLALMIGFLGGLVDQGRLVEPEMDLTAYLLIPDNLIIQDTGGMSSFTEEQLI